MTDVSSFREDIEKYETQLSQVQQALSITPEGHDRDNLLSLQSDILELIALTKESLKSAEGKDTSDNEDDGLSLDGTSESQDENEDDPMVKQYAMFEAALKEDKSESADQIEKSEAAKNSNIEDELKSLEGMKCRAPYGKSWGGTGLHNAMVSSTLRNLDENIASINDIKVRVLFINPTHKEMLPCEYFLDGTCKFSEEKCHYSHGEIVQFSSLREYRAPDFSTIKMGSRVLAKEKNKIWHRSVILKIPERDGDLYRVKFEASGNIIEVPVHDTLPLEDDELDMSDSLEDSDGSMHSGERRVTENEEIIQSSLLKPSTNEPLGKWEQHTRGIGSKLMALMGYITGTGLGKRADGRVIPVEATVLPSGKSLDHCMELRQNARGNENLFTVERRIRRQRQKLEKRREKQYQKEKDRECNVFNFINHTLGDRQPDKNGEPGSSKPKNDLKTETTRGLNVASFRVGEDISRLERETSKLMTAMGKHAKGSIPYNNIVLQYNEKQNELSCLRSKQKNIAAEQNYRKDKAKLSVF